MKIFNFEVYLNEPVTHESGWEIAHINVYAETLKEAKEKLKNVPDFDCIILFNHELDMEHDYKFIDDLSEDRASYAHGNYYRFTSIGGETILSPYYFE